MNPEVEHAREQVELARAKAEQLGKQLWSTPPSADPAYVHLVWEYSDSVTTFFEAEHNVAKAENGTPGITGTQGEYRWLSSVDYGIGDLLSLCPAVVLTKRIAVTSIDNGTLQPTPEEKNAGWWTTEECKVYSALSDDAPDYRGLVAYSPRLQSIHGLPNETHLDCPRFDEWYVFDGETPASNIESFVNWSGLRFYDLEGYGSIIHRFWKEMTALHPESYIAEGDVLTFATRNIDLFNAVIAAFSADLRTRNLTSPA